MCCLGAPVQAVGLPEPKADFSADSVLQTTALQVTSKVFYSPGMERREHRTPAGTQIIIVRHDKKLIWVLLPEQKRYIETALPETQAVAGNLPPGSKVDKSKIGAEVVNGVPTDKYRVAITQPGGATLKGIMWTSPDDIIVKMQVNTAARGSNMDLRLELRNLQRGKQDPQLFAIPSGYTAIDTPHGINPEVPQKPE